MGFFASGSSPGAGAPSASAAPKTPSSLPTASARKPPQRIIRPEEVLVIVMTLNVPPRAAGLPLNARQHRVNAECPRCQAAIWWMTAPVIIEKQRCQGRIRFKLHCQKCGHCWWYQRRPECPEFRAYRILLQLCSIPWAARGLISYKRDLVRMRHIANLFGVHRPPDATEKATQWILETQSRRTLEIQKRYGIPGWRVSLLHRAAVEFDSLVSTNGDYTKVSDEGLRVLCRRAYDRVWGEHKPV